jgi:DNA replication and repair protein RecF
MQVRRLNLACFRNYRELDFRPGPGLNILHGGNAQGKSNILEALWLLATTRSLRASRESELILRGEEMALVGAEIDREREGEVDLQVSVFQTDKKSVRINGAKRARVVELLGQYNAVFFGSIDLAIVTGEPADRRHYLNVEISQISPRYVFDLARYKRVLEQRNRLLRDLRERPRPPAESGLEAWNEQLVRYGAPLYDRRRFYIERLAPLADLIHRELTDGRESLQIEYVPSIPLPADSAPGAPENCPIPAEGVGTEIGGSPGSSSPAVDRICAEFARRLAETADDELRRGVTLLGPQRDDLSFLVNGAEARIYGSQGQQRTVALALKLAEFRLVEDFVGEPPVLLLDDVMSDLDDARRAHLLAWIRRRCQAFLTCTSLSGFPEDLLAEARTHTVLAGVITEDERAPASRSTPEAAAETGSKPAARRPAKRRESP